MTSNPFQKAVREGVKIRLLLYGKSGGGKSRTGLQLACHISAITGEKVAAICTETGSLRRYAPEKDKSSPCLCDRCCGHKLALDFDLLDLEDHSPEAYRKYMAAAAANGYGILFIDGISQEWTWCLEEIDALKATTTNKVSPWSKVTPLHDRFMVAIREWPGHVIVTCRAKEKVDAKANSRGLLPIQRSDEELYFEFDLCATVQDGGRMRLTKARDTGTPLQGKSYRQAGADAARDLVEWSGELDQEALKREREAAAKAAEQAEAKKRERRAEADRLWQQLPKDQKNPGDVDRAEKNGDLDGFIDWARGVLKDTAPGTVPGGSSASEPEGRQSPSPTTEDSVPPARASMAGRDL